MMDYPVPINELARLDELYRYEILDSPAEEFYDRLTEMAAQTFDVPIALISLIDRNRQWCKSHHGLAASETPREQAFCAHAILGNEPIVVEDAAADPRFFDNPLVRGDPEIRFYVAAPLVTARGFVIGTLCVIDRRPRTPTAEQMATLRQLATQVVQQFELRHVVEVLRRQSLLLEKVQHAARIGGWEIDLKSNVLTWTDETYRIHGLSRHEYTPTVEASIALYTPESAALIRQAVEAAISVGTPYNLELQLLRQDGEIRWVRTSGMRVDGGGKRYRLFGVVQDITEQRRLEQEIVLIAQREQIRIGSDLHDGLGQELTGIALMLKALSARDLKRAPVDPGELEQLEALARQAIIQCRSLAQGVSPTGQELGGLVGATRQLAARIEKIHGIAVRVRLHGRGIHLDPAVADHLYRIIQEALNNAIKHAAARRLVIAIYWNPRRTLVCVTNDGLGFSSAPPPGGLGLGIMHYRARLIGATLSIEPGRSGGTRIRCRLPNQPAGSTPRVHPYRIDAESPDP